MGLGDTRGALIADVIKGGPAKAAGLERGDVVVSYDGKPINDSQELPLLVGRTPVGQTVKLKLIRDKAVKEVSATITPSREEELRKASAFTELTPPAGKDDYRLGLYLKDLTSELAREFGRQRQQRRRGSRGMRPGGAAEQAGTARSRHHPGSESR